MLDSSILIMPLTYVPFPSLERLDVDGVVGVGSSYMLVIRGLGRRWMLSDDRGIKEDSVRRSFLLETQEFVLTWDRFVAENNLVYRYDTCE